MSGLEYCGKRIYSLVDVSPTSDYRSFMTFDFKNRRISAKTDREAHVGIYQITLRAELEEFPDIHTETTFNIEVKFCKIL